MIVTRWVDNFKPNYLDSKSIQTYTSPYTIQGKKQNYLEKGILNVSNPNILKKDSHQNWKLMYLADSHTRVHATPKKRFFFIVHLLYF